MSDYETVRISRSGFDWEDAEWRFLAFDGRFYGYGPTPEMALERYEEVAR